jgi:hypothetical protein
MLGFHVDLRSSRDKSEMNRVARRRSETDLTAQVFAGLSGIAARLEVPPAAR